MPKTSSIRPSILIEHRLVTDRQTDRHWAIASSLNMGVKCMWVRISNVSQRNNLSILRNGMREIQILAILQMIVSNAEHLAAP